MISFLTLHYSAQSTTEYEATQLLLSPSEEVRGINHNPIRTPSASQRQSSVSTTINIHHIMTEVLLTRIQTQN